MSSDIKNILDNLKREEDQKTVQTNLDLSRLPKAELNKLFSDALHKIGVTYTWKFKDAERALINTPIWNAIKSYQERKNLFNEYIENYRAKEREEAKLKREKLKQKFKKMIEESPYIRADTKYSEAMTIFSNDDRWRCLEERDREEIYQDYIDILTKKEEKENDAKRKEQREKLGEILQEMNISSDTKWTEINIILKDNELFNSMFKIDQLDAFKDYILSLERKERIKKREDEKYIGYQNREKFRDLLQSYLDENKITMGTKWKDFATEIQNRDEYKNLLLQSAISGSTPREIFMDLINALKTDYKSNKKILKKILKENSIKFDSNISFEDYEAVLDKYDDYKLIRKGVKPILFEHFMHSIKEKEEEKNNREMKIAKKIKKYIGNKKLNISENDDPQTALKAIKKLNKFENINDDSILKGFQIMKTLPDVNEENESD
ncbi:MAG: hypothetical protein MJ252_00960 [archaeon]|nr:hypothetical protein [archaeon]